MSEVTKKDYEKSQVQLRVLHQHMFGFLKDVPKPPELHEKTQTQLRFKQINNSANFPH